jgi:hypothetical protein
VRQGFSLLSSAAAGAQVDLQERFHLAAGVVTALVLIPSLVVELYGATVDGLPGQSETLGLAFVGIYSALGATGTIVALHFARTRRWRALAVTLAVLVGTIVSLSVAA